MNNFMSASEFAKFCGVTKDTLRWYDKLGILKPAVKRENGYRYYTSRQFFDFSMICTLKQTGNSLREIRAFQQKHSGAELLQLFAEKQIALDIQMRQLAQMKYLVDAIYENLSLAQQHPMEQPELIWQDTAYLAATPIPEGYGWFEMEPEAYTYAHIRTYQDVAGIAQYPLGTILSADSLRGAVPKEIAYFYPAERDAIPTLWEKPAGQYVRIFHKGDYGAITDTLKTAAEFMEQNCLKSQGDIYEYDCVTYLAESVEEFVEMLLIPVEKKRKSDVV